MGIYVLQLIGIIILSIIFLILLLIVTNTSYEAKGYANNEEYGYSFKVGIFQGIIKFIGQGKGQEFKLIFKIFFLEKKIQLGLHNKDNKNKKNKRDKGKKDKKDNNKDNLINKLKDIKKYKEPFIKILSILKPKYFRLEGVYGFEDPSITGMLCGIIAVLPSIFPKAIININPDFSDEVIDIETEIKGKIRIILILLIGARLFISNKFKKIKAR